MKKILFANTFVILCFAITSYCWSQTVANTEPIVLGILRPLPDKMGWRCQGIAHFPDATQLGINLIREHPLFEVVLMQQIVLVKSKRFQSDLVVGQNLPPGRYRIVVFFSPELQKNRRGISASQPPQNGITKTSPAPISFTEVAVGADWRLDEYAKIFAQHQQEAEKFLDDSMRVWLMMKRDYQDCLQNKRWERWQMSAHTREHSLEQLKQAEHRLISRYASPFFYTTLDSLYPLYGMLYCFHTEAVSFLQQQQTLASLTISKNFIPQWLHAKYFLRKEIMALSPERDVAIFDETRKWVNEIKQHIQEDSFLNLRQSNGQNTAPQNSQEANGQNTAPQNSQQQNSSMYQTPMIVMNNYPEKDLPGMIQFFPILVQFQQNIPATPNTLDINTIQWLAQMQNVYQQILNFNQNMWPNKLIYYHAILSLISQWQSSIQKNERYQNCVVIEQTQFSWSEFQTWQQQWLDHPNYYPMTLKFILEQLQAEYNRYINLNQKSGLSETVIQDTLDQINDSILQQQQAVHSFLRLSHQTNVRQFLEQYQILSLQIMVLVSSESILLSHSEKESILEQIRYGFQQLSTIAK